MPNEEAKGGKTARKKPKLVRYLLILALATTMVASATLARYSSLSAITASMQVAAFASAGTVDFAVDLEGLSPGNKTPRTIQFAVQNYDEKQDCQTALDYTVRVETTGNLPLKFVLRGQTGEIAENNQPAGSLSPVSGQEHVWEAAGGKLPPAGERKQHKYELAVTWDETAEGLDYSHEIDMVTVTVTTTQADPTAS